MVALVGTGRPKELVLPRFGTPRNPDLPTRGGQVATVAERLRLPMMPHLRYMADVLLEYDPDNEGRQLYQTGDVNVMRQVGKTMGLVTPVMVHRVTMVPHRLGRQRVSFLMHKRDKARQKLERDIIPLLREADGFIEIRNPKGKPGRSTREWKPSLNNGGENIQFGRGNYLQIDTPSKTAAHSDTLDLAAFDEIRFAVDDRVEQGAVPTMITRTDRLFLRSSTAGDEESFYMWPLVVAGRKRCETGDHGDAAYFEYSIPDDADLHDPEVWFEYHPAVGRTISIDDIMALLRAAEDHPDPSKLDVFRQEYANQWVRHPQLAADVRDEVLAKLAEVWADRHVKPSKKFKGPGVLGVDVAPNGTSSAIVVAGPISDGRAAVKVLDRQEGTWWAESALVDHGTRYAVTAIAYDGGGPAKAMAGAFARAAGKIARETGRECKVVAVSGADYKASCQAFVAGFVEGVYRHTAQEWLDTAISGATRKKHGDGWLWDRRSEFEDITPLPAATVAFRALDLRPPQDDDRRSAYEDDDLLVV